MSNTIQGDFPFKEIRDANGDLFPAATAALYTTGFDYNHIWALIEGEDGEKDGYRTGSTTYGPPHHSVNVLGFIATKEAHDGDTYYEETYEMGDLEVEEI